MAKGLHHRCTEIAGGAFERMSVMLDAFCVPVPTEALNERYLQVKIRIVALDDVPRSLLLACVFIRLSS